MVAASKGTRRGHAGRNIGLLFVFVLLIGAGWLGYQRGWIPVHLLRSSGNKAPVLSAPKQMTVTTGDRVSFELQAGDAEEDTIRFYSDELPAGAKLSADGEFVWAVDHNQSGQHKIKFYADDGTSASVSETVIDVEAANLALDFRKLGKLQVDAGKHFRKTLVASSTSGNRVRFSLEKAPDGMQIQAGELVWDPDGKLSGSYKAVVKATDGYITKSREATFQVRSLAEQEAAMARVEWNLPEKANIFVDGNLKDSETRSIAVDLPKGRHTLRAELMNGATGWVETLELNPGEKLKLEAPKLAYGKLSVYFLGGVGEFRVNGKLFETQPPFSGISVPAGTHRISCRMANESNLMDFDITVVEGRETVVEYEAGSEPVVTIDN